MSVYWGDINIRPINIKPTNIKKKVCLFFATLLERSSSRSKHEKMKSIYNKEKCLMSYEKGFIKFYNCFMENGEFKLTPKEWYFYSLLAARWNPFLNMAETTISRISEVQTVYKDKKRPTNDKVNTLKQIANLQSKGVITISNYDELTFNGKTNYDRTLLISFTDYIQSESIYNDVYSRTTDPNELYFMCVLQRFNSKGFNHSMEQIATLFDCNIKTAERTIATMKEKKLIKYVQGEVFQGKNGQYSKKPNTYFIRGVFEVDTEPETTVTEDVVSTDTPTDSELFMTMYGEVTLEYLQRKIQHSNWGRKTINKQGKTVNAALVEDDINIMMTCEELGIEPAFTKRSRNVITSMARTFDMNDINSWIDQYGKVKERKIKQEEAFNTEQESIKQYYESDTHVIEREGSVLLTDDLNINDVLIYVVQQNAEYGKIKDKIKKISIKSLVCGITNAGTPRLSTDTFNKVFDYAKDLLSDSKMSKDILYKVSQFRDAMLIENNHGLAPDVEHEGDIFVSYDGYSETNESLTERRRMIKLEKKRQEDEMNRIKKQENEIDIASLFD